MYIMNLTSYQKRKLREHAHHHTHKHMIFMVRSMQRGAAFNQAHIRALKKVGT